MVGRIRARPLFLVPCPLGEETGFALAGIAVAGQGVEPSMTEPLHEIDEEQLIRRAADGDGSALAELFGRYRKRLRQMVRLRLDRRLQGRVDASDVLQEAYLDVAQQLPSLTWPSARCRFSSGCGWWPASG